jgi:hypothetical protein
MKKVIQHCFIIAALLSSNSGFGYFYHVCVMRKVVNKSTNTQQLVLCLGDYHLKSHPANGSQRVYIESLLKRCVTLKSKLIVEDLSSVNNDGRMVCCNFGINCSEGVLGQLANKARSLGVAVDNVEYRYCRVAGVGPLLTNIQTNPHSFRSSATIATSSLHKEVVDEIEKIKKYNDGKILNDLYKRTTGTVQSALSKIGFNGKATVADYCTPLQRKQYRQELEKLCIFDSALIDMNIMHSIAACPDTPFIFVIAGGSHVEQVSSVLKRMGYESVLKISGITAPGLKKVLNSDATTVPSDIHPEPIDITILDKFIRKN